VYRTRGLELFEFISVSSGTGSQKIKYLFQFGSEKKIRALVPENLGTDKCHNFKYFSEMRV